MPTTVLRAPPDFHTLRRPCHSSSQYILGLVHMYASVTIAYFLDTLTLNSISSNDFRGNVTYLNLNLNGETKGQLISKQNCRAITSPKKQTLDFYF